MHDLTRFQRDLLYVIAGLDEPHGLAIKDELESYYETEIHHGRLYPNLDTLVDKGSWRRASATAAPTTTP
jgi:DNA-binding PadR family transcriptional regulator